MTAIFLQGDARVVLQGLPADLFHCVVTSPPYFGLRKYEGGEEVWDGAAECGHEWGEEMIRRDRGSAKGASAVVGNQLREVSGVETRQGNFCIKCGSWRGQLGSESDPGLYIQHLVEICQEVKRVLRPDGVFWLSIGDSWAGYWGDKYAHRPFGKDRSPGPSTPPSKPSLDFKNGSIKPLDMILIPSMLALALRSNGWYVRSMVVWCLSGGTYLYTRAQKGDMPMMIQDMVRLDPKTVKLWNGEKWTQVLGWSKANRVSDELELVLRSGERISCSPNHRFPTEHGLLSASNISVGDCLLSTTIPEPVSVKDSSHIGLDAAWLAGLYLAEGSKADDTIQIAGNVSDEGRWERIQCIVASYGGVATRTIKGNKMDIRIYGKVLNAIIAELVSGHNAKTKCLATVCWRYSNVFLRELLDGYLSGDGGWDEKNQRWRLGFARNYNLERDLRVLASRLSFHLVLNLSYSKCQTGTFPSHKGEIRFSRNGHPNEKNPCEVVAIQKSRCREVYDIGVEDEPHIYALASGVLTHNSKSNPMPESVNGWRWEHHKVKVESARSSTQPSSTVIGDGRRDNFGGLSNTLATVWQECPGCPKCSPNDGYVLRKGSWRPTDAHEYILMLTKTNHYFCDREAVLEPIAESTIGRGRVDFGGAKGRAYTPDRGDPNFRGGSEQWGRTYDYTESNSNGGRNTRSVWSFPTKPGKFNHYACVDDATDCLTAQGWKRYNELRIGEMVASYDLVKGRLRWTPLLSVSCYDVVDTDMVGFEHRSLSMLLTPDHRCVVHVRGKDSIAVKRADGISASDRILVSADWDDSVVGAKPISPEMAALIGWYLTEGYEQKAGSGIEIYQSLTANGDKVAIIRSLLQELRADFEEATFSRLSRGAPTLQTTFNVGGFVAHKIRELCPAKSFPVGVLLWDKSLLMPMFDAMILGDGVTRSDERRFFVQKDKRRLGMFQAVAVRLGHAASIFPRADGGCSCVSVYEKRRYRVTYNSRRSLFRKTQYSGVIWCPQTTDTTFVARRDGKMFITGNSYPPRLPETCIKSSTSEKGCCPKCGAPWARVIEKGFTAHNGSTDSGYSVGSTANRLALLRQAAREQGTEYTNTPQTIDWRPTCACGAGDPISCRVLDPFSGAGTTALVAEQLGLDSVSIDTSAEYIQLSKDRLADDEQKRIDEFIKTAKRSAKKSSANNV